MNAINFFTTVLLVIVAFNIGKDTGQVNGWYEYHQGKVECTKVFERTECRLIGGWYVCE